MISQSFLVTGAAGFIASKICEQLLAQGHHVIGVDNLSRASDPSLKSLRLRPIANNRRFTFLELDVTDWPRLNKALLHVQRDRRLAAVLHLAARAGVRE